MIDLNHPSNIVPKGAQYASVKPVNFAVRTLMEYDVNFLRDRLRADIFIDGKPAGVYACVAGFDDMHPEEAMRVLGPEVEKQVIDEFMGLGYRRQVRDLERQVRELQEHINRPRWFQFRPVRRVVGGFFREASARATRAWEIVLRGDR